MLHRLEMGGPVEVLDMLFAETRGHINHPWVMVNMVTSVDGATALRGGASALNDADDRALFLALRSVADIVLVGAQTVRSENMGPVRMNEEMSRYRNAAGLEGEPRLAILTRSLDLDVGARVFADRKSRPIVVTQNDSDQHRLAALSEVAEIVQAPVLDGAGIVAALGKAKVILCEGGPTINSQLIAAGVVDEINVTVTPLFAMGESKRIAFGAELDPPAQLQLDRVLLGDRSLFLRYIKDEAESGHEDF